jgi:hypothetical protein
VTLRALSLGLFRDRECERLIVVFVGLNIFSRWIDAGKPV